MYNHTKPSEFTLKDCEEAVGSTAKLILTGEIIDAGESTSGPYVKFQVDERFGFGTYIIGLDLDALELD